MPEAKLRPSEHDVAQPRGLLSTAMRISVRVAQPPRITLALAISSPALASSLVVIALGAGPARAIT
jgi:hypothetical protein